MFNKQLIKEIERNFSEFGDIKFSLNGYNFARSPYDILNACIIYNAIIDERTDNIVIFHPTDSIFLLYIVMISSFAALERDITDNKNIIEKNLVKGDWITYKGNLGIYEGIFPKELGGKTENRVKIYFGGKNPEWHYIKKSDFWRIRKYSGNAKKLRGFKGRKEKIDSMQALSSILKIDRKILSVVRPSSLAVITDKKDFIDLIREVKVNDYEFISLFPSVKILGSLRRFPITSAKVKAQPVIYVMSNINTLHDFLSEWQTVNTVVVDGISKIKYNYGMIDSLKEHNGLENFLLLLNHRDIAEKSKIENVGFKSWVWDYHDMKELFSDFKIKLDENSPFYNHYKVLINLARQQVQIINADFTQKEIGFIFKAIRNSIVKIVDYLGENSYVLITDFINACYGLLSHFQHLPFPQKFAEEIASKKDTYSLGVEKYLAKINTMAQVLILRVLPDFLRADVESIVSNFSSVKSYFDVDNQKANKLVEFLVDNQSGCAIVVKKSWHIEFLKLWLSEQNISVNNVIDFYSLKGLRRPIDCQKLIFCGWFGRSCRWIFNSGIAPKIYFLCYPFEEKLITSYLNALSSNKLKFRDKNTRAELLSISVNKFEKDVILQAAAADHELTEQDLTDIIADAMFKVYSQMGYSYVAGDETDVIKARHVLFVDDAQAFLTENYKAKVLNSFDAKIEQKDVNQVSVGDELILLKDSRKDVFEELIRVSEASIIMKNEMRLVKLWKSALTKYMTKDKIKADDVAIELEKYGCKRHPFTIDNWLRNERLIAPSDERKVLKAISELTGDTELRQNLQAVIHACLKLRALHIRLGHYLANCILASLDPSGEAKIEGFMKEKIQELSQHVYTSEVRFIGEDFVAVERSITNRLIEFGEQ